MSQSAITETQEISLFEILGIPFSSTGFTVTDFMGSVRTNATINPSAVILPDIEAYLNLKVGDAAWIAKLVAYITRWDALGTSTTNIVAGSVCEINGINNDPDTERALIRDRVRNMVPFWTYYDFLCKQAGTTVSVPFIR